MTKRSLQTLGVIAALCLAPNLPVGAQPPEKGRRNEFVKDSPAVLAAFKEVANKASPSTVRISSEGKELALGTVVGSEGWILTKASELKGKLTCQLKDGREFAARTVGVHEGHDLAMLKIEAKGLTPVEWIKSKYAEVGNWVASPGTGSVPVAVGVVSVGVRDLGALRGTPPTAANSGGYLGIAFDPNEAIAKVTQVLPRSGAEKAGLKTDDVIVKVGGKPVVNMESLLKSLQRHKPGDVIQLHVKRGDKELDLTATLGKRPPGRSDFQNSLGSELSDRRTGFRSVLQHDSVLRARDCGGPLIDLDGRAIGINVARAGRTETYAIPSEVILPLLPDLMSGKLAPLPEVDRTVSFREALKKAELEKEAADKKVADAKAALDKAQAERAAAEKKLAEARAALDKAEKESKGK